MYKSSTRDKSLRVIIWLICLGIFTEVWFLYLHSIGKENYLAYNLYIVLETGFLLYYFTRIIDNATFKKIILVTYSTFFLVWLLLFIKAGNKSYLDQCVNVENIIIIILTIYFFFREIKSPESLFIYNHPKFWVVTAFFLYCAGTFFLFSYISFLPPDDQQLYLKIVNDTFLVLRILLLSIAMLIKVPEQTRKKFTLT